MMTDIYILLATKNGKKKKDKKLVTIRTNPGRVELLAGSLLRPSLSLGTGDTLHTVNDRNQVNLVCFESIDTADIVEVQCAKHEIEKLRGADSDLLRPIPTCVERLDVYKNKDWLLEGSTLKQGDTVFVKIKGHQSELPGLLRYRGPLPDLPGLFFGVELTENRGEGTCNGSYQKKQYFLAPDHSAVFCPLHKIRKGRESWQKSDRDRAIQSSGCLEMSAQEDELRIGDRVMWPSDNGNEYGTVRWIGHLPDDISGEKTVGVEFDNAIGTGTGKYKDQRLFYTRHGHASLVPLMGLIKVDPQEEIGGVIHPDLDHYSPGKEFDPEYVRQQEKLLRQIQLSAAQENSAPALPPRSHNMSSPFSSEDRSRSSSSLHRVCSSPYKGLDQQVHGMEVESGFSKLNKVAIPVPVEEGPGTSGVPDFALKDVGEDLALNPLYLLSKSSEAAERISGDIRQSSTGSQSSASHDPDLVVGSLVEVLGKPPRYGVIRWIGPFDAQNKVIAGLEMEEEISAGTDGTFRGERHFTCPPRKALFVPLNKCRKDKRFHSDARDKASQEEFGTLETPDVPGDISPPEVYSPEELMAVCGKQRGIQGHHNSCYLDATLFSMFYFTTVFDFIFNKPFQPGSSHNQQLVQKVLKEGIVNPLRSFHYVRADKVLQLRELLDKLGTIPGMMGEEKDPEEFLSALLSQIMKADPLLHLSSGEHTYFYQLFIEKDEKLLLPTTQILVELSFLQGNVKLKEVPSCLMLQMPRFGKDYKMYRRIIPSLELDITDILETGIRECIVCGTLATYECKDCYSQHGQGLNTTAFCEQCITKSHQHKKRQGHNPQPLLVPREFLPRYARMQEEARIVGGQNGEVHSHSDVVLPREKMELFAVVCIQTSHYVSFVKCGMGKSAPWVFFDSMADRQGEQGGYNIPEVQHVPELTHWLSETNFESINEMEDDRQLPEHMRRLLCDAYMVMYQSPSVMMFR